MSPSVFTCVIYPWLCVYFSPPAPRAPMAHPHVIDPFREVKEYMMEAEDYSHSLNDKINVRTLHDLIFTLQPKITHRAGNVCIKSVKDL